MFELSPSRVRIIFIWFRVLFCISSAMTKVFLKVRPRMYAKGTISTWVFLM